MTEYPKIAFFDVDHTLMAGNSGYLATIELIRYGILKKRRLLQALYFRALNQWGSVNIEAVYRVATRDIIGRKVHEIMSLGEEIFQKTVRPLIYQEALKMIEQQRSAQARIVLLTSGSKMIMESFAHFVKADAYFAISLKTEGDCILDEFELPLCHGAYKIHYAELAARELGVGLDQCAFYTDHFSDIPLLEKVGLPNVVNPDWRLRRRAKQKNWPVHQFSQLLKNAADGPLSTFGQAVEKGPDARRPQRPD